MVASSIVPTGLLVDDAGTNGVTDVKVEARNVPLERLVTVAYDGTIGAPVSALWVELDGERLTEDTRGHGHYDEIQFKVGVKPASGRTLRIGDQNVELTPTDVVTVRAFTGAILVRGAGTQALEVQLDGDVQATLVNEANVNRLQTEGRRSLGDTPANLAYVVLDAGGKRNTVDVVPGGESVATRKDGNTTVPIPVEWVRVGDDLLKDYTWNEGHVAKLEFLPKATSDGLAVDGDRRSLNGDTRVVIKEFIGTYIVFRNAADDLLLKIDGYADDVHLVGTDDTSATGLFPKPVAAFDYEPKTPTTSDAITFYDRSVTSSDAQVLLREWKFGDGTVSTAENPKHRFTEPGRTYTVSLVVTDSHLARSDPYVVNITVANSAPVAEFDFSPKFPTDVEIVQFNDKSWDVDGEVESWTWDFGDGFTSTDRSPSHIFADNGTYTVTLTIEDDHGATNTVSKVVRVSNVRPSAAFTLNPVNPTVLDVVTFEDRSRDPDGGIEGATWDFGDGSTATGSSVQHRFTSVGSYDVTLTVVDDDGEASTVRKTITVLNIPPVADFTVLTQPADRTTASETCFRDTSTDDEGRIASRHWTFGDGSSPRTGEEVCHTYPSTGTYTANLTVKDRHGATSWKQVTVEVLNGAPMSDLFWSVESPLTLETVAFHSAASDPDGAEDIVRYEWWFPHDGMRVSGPNATSLARSFGDNGVYAVYLNVTDSEGHESSASRSITVRNRAPHAFFTMDTDEPSVGEPVTFTGRITDPDGHVVSVKWDFGDGTIIEGDATAENLTVVHTFQTAEIHDVVIIPTDDDGDGPLVVRATAIDVLPPPPVPDFTWTPTIVPLGDVVTFADASVGVGSNVVAWDWEFGDGAGSPQQDPSHVYRQAGTYDVTLTAIDDANPQRSASITKTLEVNTPPVADFVMDVPRLRVDLQFLDASSDVDGVVSNWTWDFGDGTLSFDRNPVHRYESAGTYRIVLTVRDDDGTTATTATTVAIRNLGPSASFTFMPVIPVANSTVTFTSGSTDLDGDIVSETWRLTTTGVNEVILATGVGSSFSYLFTETGVYRATLTVTDNDGGLTQVTRLFRVTSDEVKTLTFGLVYPDGSGFDFDVGSVSMDLTLTRSLSGASVSIPTNIVLATAGSVTIALPAQSWAAGDALTVDLETSSQGRDLTSVEFALDAAADQVSAATALLEMYAMVEVVVEPPENSAVGTHHQVEPGVYTFADQTERVYIVVSATWEGSNDPVKEAGITLQITYSGGRGLFPGGIIVDRYLSPTGLGSPVTRTVDGISSGTDGIARIAVPYFAPLEVEQPFEGENAGAYLPGWYRATGGVSIDGYQYPLVRGQRGEFMQDPGGALQLGLDQAGIDRVPWVR